MKSQMGAGFVFIALLSMMDSQPVALSILSDGNLLILNSQNVLTILEPKSGVTQRLQLQRGLQAIDMAACGRLDENLIFVASRGPGSQLSAVTQYSASGKEMHRWTIPGTYPSGLALDCSQRILYISTLQGGSIYRLDLKERDGGRPRYLISLPSATRLGPLAFDSSGGRLFVADAFSGNVYSVYVRDRKSVLLIDGLGTPSALAISPQSTLLYVTDRAKRCVWTVRLDMNFHQATQLEISQSLAEPLGIAVDQSGIIWVGDRSSSSPIKLSPKMNVIRKAVPLSKQKVSPR